MLPLHPICIRPEPAAAVCGLRKVAGPSRSGALRGGSETLPLRWQWPADTRVFRGTVRAAGAGAELRSGQNCKRRCPSRSWDLRQTGFTLLELLVAAVAGAVLMAALVMVLGGAWRLQQQAAENEAAGLPREAAQQRLRREFQAAVPPSGLIAAPLISQTVKAGDWRHDDVQWVAAIGATNPDTPGEDLVALHYYLATGATVGSYNLVRTERRNALTTTDTTSAEVVILEGVVSFMLTWYDGQTWQDSWDSTAQQNQLPQAVRVRVDFATVDTRQPLPLELIVPFSMRTLSAQTAARSTPGGGS